MFQWLWDFLDSCNPNLGDDSYDKPILEQSTRFWKEVDYNLEKLDDNVYGPYYLAIILNGLDKIEGGPFATHLNHYLETRRQHLEDAFKSIEERYSKYKVKYLPILREMNRLSDVAWYYAITDQNEEKKRLAERESYERSIRNIGSGPKVGVRTTSSYPESESKIRWNSSGNYGTYSGAGRQDW